ncbi:MAG: class I SAM-dependent methyltransferase [Candidatus Ratteibacteria bacterium]|nr:class I SAM-dependent methyltransferase [Candidatus Ratteibacteria bacterium]
MEEKVLLNHKRYLERVNFNKSFGYNVEEERKFILDKVCPIDGNILEVGTGKGYFAIELAKRGYSFTSVDLSAEEQEFARLNIEYFGLLKQVDFKIEDAENLSFKDKSFDVVFAINAIHHFAKPFKAIDEFIRVVKPKGKIVLSDFSEEGFKMIDKIHASEGRKHEAGKVTLDEISDYLENKGFKVQKYKSKLEDIVVAFFDLYI